MSIKGATRMMDKWYFRTWMKEEDIVAEGEANTAKADTIKSVTPTNAKPTEMVP